MTLDRYGHTMTALADGRVLVTGGVDYSGTPGIDTSAELWTPSSGLWAPAGALLTPRVSHTATLLADGRVLITGGYNKDLLRSLYRRASATTVALANAEVWDPASGRASASGSMTEGRSGHMALSLADGRVLVVGGSQAGRDGSRFLDSAEVWSPSDGRFRDAGRLARPVAGGTLTGLSDGRVLLVDGEDAQTWDPGAGQWSPAGKLREARSGHTATLLADGRVLVTGGSCGDGCGVLATAEVWSPTTSQWTAIASMSVRRQHHTAALLPGGRVLIVGGSEGGGETGNERFAAQAEIWEPGTARFRVAGKLAVPRANHTMALLPDGSVIIAGGLRSAGRRPEGSQIFNTLSSAEVWRNPVQVRGVRGLTASL